MAVPRIALPGSPVTVVAASPSALARLNEAPKRPAGATAAPQSACLRRKAGISISSMPLLASASTLAAAVRPLRQTLGVFNPS